MDPLKLQDPTPPPPLTRNFISYAGWLLTLSAGVLIGVLILADILFFGNQPYNSLITYLVLPGFLAGGVALILGGAFWEWLSRHRKAPHVYPLLPVVNLNENWQRRRIAVGSVLLAVFLGVSAVAAYRAYHFTESATFCGRICHYVMKPEYTAYQHSPHARVSCTECHIGSGAEWYVRYKLTGLRQVWAVLTKSYHLPIETPVANLRPARETCEECHWPSIFKGSMEKVIWHFGSDESNSPSRCNLLMRVGGSQLEGGTGLGIHWHISPNVQVRYWARDAKRMDIPWVETRIEGSPPQVYRSADCPPELPKDANIRVMDCVDCHNRPSHIYQSPRHLIDASLASGALDASLPFLKRVATQLLEKKHSDTSAAMAAIDKTLTERYASLMKGSSGAEMVRRNIAQLQSLYRENFFPEQNVDWREYPNHLGHYEFPGCARCHDGKHLGEKGKSISDNCDLCHELVDQEEGEASFKPPQYRRADFIHPRNLGDVWKGKLCTECHQIQR